MRGLLGGRKLVWAAVALVCTAAGAVGSVLGAHAVARSDSGKARQSAQQTSAQIAATVKLALRHEEDIAVGAATYFAGNSKTTPKEFAVWVKWARTLRRYPELDGLSLVTLVHASELAAFGARITGQAVKPAASSPAATASPAKPAGGALRVVPASNHPYYCLAIANLVRGPAKSPPAGLDYCAVTPGLLLSRDSGLSSYSTVLAGGTKALAIDTPSTGATSHRAPCSDATRRRPAGCARCWRRASCWRKPCAATRLPLCASATARARRI